MKVLKSFVSKRGGFALAVLLASGVLSFAEIIPQDRRPTWQGYAGVPGGIPNRTTIFVNLKTTTNTRYKCYANGSTDDSGAIMNAINDCPAGQVVYAPAGTYYCASQIRVYGKSNWTLRGDGPSQTVFKGGGSALFNIGNSPWLSSWPAATAITGGGTKGSSSITVASTANIALNQLVWLEQVNDGTSVFGFGVGSGTAVSNADDRMHDNSAVLNTRVMVTNISGSTVSFTPPLPFDFNQAQSPKAIGFGGQVGPTFAGLEDLTAYGSSSGQGISFQSSFGCWLKNVELRGYSTFGLEFGWSACCEVRHSYVHEPADYNWSHGYAMQFDAANNMLIEDNIFWKNESGIIVQGGSAANVFGYNFMFQVYNLYGGLQNQAQTMYGNHTPYPTMNLWEGNCASGFQEDFYYGPSSRTTLFRNYLNSADPDITQGRIAISMDSHQWSNSVVGNILGSSCTHAPIYAALPNVNISWANTTAQTWTYDSGTRSFSPGENMIFRLGYPFSGNNSSGGSANPPSTSQLNYLDLSVKANTLIHGNWDYATKTVIWDPNISDHAVPNSYYLSGKPSWFGNLNWPPFDPSNPTAADLTSIPAGYRFVYGTNPPSGPVNLAPIAVASSSPKSGSTPLSVAFSSTGSYDPEGVSLSFNWTFGDGGSATAANPTHVYATPGTFSARLIVSDGVNTTSSSNITITALIPGTNQPPTALASATPTSGLIPLTVNFSSAGSSDPEGTALTYNWNFGDGASSSSANPSHSYPTAGVFQARLTVSDGTNSISSTPITIQAAAPGTGLVAAYGFDEGSGGTIADSSGNGNTGTFSGPAWAQGKYGGALSFNGTSDLVLVSNSPSLNVSSGMTLEAWVYPTASQSSWSTILHRQTDAYYLHASSPAGSMKPAGGGIFTGTESYLAANSSIPLNSWSHIAVTYDGSQMRFFINSVQVAAKPGSGVIQSNSNPLRIGGNVPYGQYFQGMIDEVRIYSRALAQSEIHTDMTTPISASSSRPAAPQNLRVVGP